MKLGEIAARLGCRLDGDPQVEIHGVGGIETAGPGEVTFLANPRYTRALRSTRASAVLIEEKAVLDRPAEMPPLAALRSNNPYLDFARTAEFFYVPSSYAPGIHPTAVVAASAKIGAGSHIGPYCYVGERAEIGRQAVLHSFVTIYPNVRIGDHLLAHSHAVVRENCRIGSRVILQNGAVVGGDGFGFARRPDGRWHKIVQQGPVVIEDDVEIQANSCIDRATVGETRVRRGTKVDDLVLVGHACDVGEDVILCGQVGLAGSTRVGNRAILAGQVGSAGHLEIGEGATITSQSGVPNDVPAGATYSGYPAMENRLWRKAMAVVKHLPDLQKAVKELSDEVARLKASRRKGS